MKSTYVDPKSGDVVCPVCGARNQFTVKRTAKAKWAGIATVGVGMAAMPKRLSCNGCGTNLKRGGSGSPPPRAASTRPSSPPAGMERPAGPTGDDAWDTLVERVKTLSLEETTGMDYRWLRRSDDRITVARFQLSRSSFSVKLKNPDYRAQALAIDGATDDQQSFIHVPHSHRDQWTALVALAAGRDPEEMTPLPLRAPDVEEPPRPVSSADPHEMTSELERLAGLHARGSLTDEEFQQAKARVLGGD